MNNALVLRTVKSFSFRKSVTTSPGFLYSCVNECKCGFLFIEYIVFIFYSGVVPEPKGKVTAPGGNSCSQQDQWKYTDPQQSPYEPVYDTSEPHQPGDPKNTKVCHDGQLQSTDDQLFRREDLHSER